MPTRRLLLLAQLLLGCSLPPTSLGGDGGQTPDAAPTPPDQAVDLTPDLALRPDGGDTLGGPCLVDTDCSTGQRCDTAQPDGMCTRDCKADGDCGKARGCLEGRCHPRCNPRAILNPCRDKYACQIRENRALCVADCRVRPCPTSGWVCDAGSGLCVDPSAGTLGAPCGLKTGTCDGTPNGVCYSVNLLKDGFCTIPCSPFTKPCPLELADAECLLGPAEAPLCAFLCDPQAPSCPHPGLSCTSSGDIDVCLP